MTVLCAHALCPITRRQSLQRLGSLVVLSADCEQTNTQTFQVELNRCLFT